MTSSQQNPPASNMYQEAYSTIAECLAKSDVGFLIGAGVSRDSGIEIGCKLAKRMLRRAVLGGKEVDNEHPILDNLASSYPFEAIAEYLVQKISDHEIAGWLCDKKQGGFDKAKPKEVHKYLHELWALLGRKFPAMVFTTNFDHLIEDEFGSDAICITSRNVTKLASAKQQNKLAVVHLHGCVTFPDSIVFGEEKQTTLEGPVFDLFRACLATEVFVMVGYSLSDTNLRHVFFNVQRVAKTREGLNKRTFAVSPADGSLVDSASEITIVKNIWEQRDVEHLAVSATDFFKNLYETSDQFAITRMRDEVASAMKKKPETLKKMLESATEQFDVIEPQDLLEYLYCALGPKKDKGIKEGNK
jgi:NAD-dependent SIR2 family protein deacetylase